MHHWWHRPVHCRCHQHPRPGIMSGCCPGQKWVLSWVFTCINGVWVNITIILFQGSSRRKSSVRTHGCRSQVGKKYKITRAVGTIWLFPSPSLCSSPFYQLPCSPRSITRKSTLLSWKSLGRCLPLRDSLPLWPRPWPSTPTWPTCSPRPSGTEMVMSPKTHFMTIITLRPWIIHVLPPQAMSRPSLTDAPSQSQLWKITMLWKLFSLLINSSYNSDITLIPASFESLGVFLQTLPKGSMWCES